MLSSIKNAVGVSMKKPQQNRSSQSRVESSVCVDGGNGFPTPGNVDLPPRDAAVSSNFNPYNSGKEPGENCNAPSSAPQRSGSFSSKPNPAAGGGYAKGGSAFPSILPAIESGDEDDLRLVSLPFHLIVELDVDLVAFNTFPHILTNTNTPLSPPTLYWSGVDLVGLDVASSELSRLQQQQKTGSMERTHTGDQPWTIGAQEQEQDIPMFASGTAPPSAITSTRSSYVNNNQLTLSSKGINQSN